MRYCGAALLCRARLVERGFLPLADAVSTETGVPLRELLGRSHRASVSRARQVLFAALALEGLSTPEIGYLLARDHTTVLHGLRRCGVPAAGVRGRS
jgi:hypothetical protein